VRLRELVVSGCSLTTLSASMLRNLQVMMDKLEVLDMRGNPAVVRAELDWQLQMGDGQECLLD
jgi:hypothetical protein